jgi:DNA-binding response OmpR family regulator
MAASSEPLVLVAEDDDDIRTLVCAILVDAGMRALSAPDGAAALELARTERPDLVVADVGLPGMDGFELCRALRELPDAPVVVFLSAHAAPSKHADGLEAGGSDYVVKPFDAAELLVRLRVALETSRGEAPSGPVALVADDDEDVRDLVAFCLEREGYEVLRAADGLEALELAVARRPDVAVLDVTMPHLSGLEVAEQLRSLPRTHDLPIVFLSARATDDDVTRGLVAGGDDYVRKPFSPAELQRRLRDLLAA